MIPKFRGKSTADENNGEWVYGNLIVDGRQASIVNGIIESTEQYISIGAWCPVDAETVGQSTGLKDKNGVEIFEGDVVTNGWKRQVVTFGTQEVEEDFGSVRIYRGFNLYLGGGYPNAVMSTFEVLGNIYENPELMEGNV
ncbi:YopX family protein [Streptococcus intermedius]|uniref:YopX family protein n=1 Tax=Streptococcus intermedius TaxID=1338 RepID=UPI002001759C|nr:YopX family protein [Streptococcus intermedius]